MTDQIIKELWYAKDKIAKDHGYDLDMLVAYLQSKELQKITALLIDVRLRKPNHYRLEAGSEI